MQKKLCKAAYGHVSISRKALRTLERVEKNRKHKKLVHSGSKPFVLLLYSPTCVKNSLPESEKIQTTVMCTRKTNLLIERFNVDS